MGNTLICRLARRLALMAALIAAAFVFTTSMTGAGAHTTVLVPPDRLYVISPAHGGILVLADS